MNDRIEAAKKFGDCLANQRYGELDDLLADDVVLSVPLMGINNSGKDSVRGALANMPASGGPAIEWSEPVEEGDIVKSVGKGSPIGPMKIMLGFSADNKINKIEVGLGS